jgi:peptide/nickel transport system permease protein
MRGTFVRNRVAVVGLILIVIIIVFSASAPYIASKSPLEQHPSGRLRPASPEYILGQDTAGRDIFSRLLHAGHISLLVGMCSVLLGGSIGTMLGLVAGYSRGRLENVIMRTVDVMMAFPSLLLGITVLAVLGSGMDKMILAIGIMLSPAFARVVHGVTLSLNEQEFVEAARAIGAGSPRILRLHILPNVLGEILVLGSLEIASAIRIEASLSFIGLGVSPPTPTWGNMIREGTVHLINAPWLSIYPGLAILITVLAFNLLGDGLRDVFDPRLQQ